MKHVPNIPKNILFLCTNKPIVSVDDIDLEEKLCPSNQYRYSPYKTLLDKFGNTFDICDVEPIIKQWYAVKIISEWFLECKFNPKYKYCQKRLIGEFEDMYRGTKIP